MYPPDGPSKCCISVDCYIVWGDDEAVFGGLEFGVLSEVVDVAGANLEALPKGIVVVRKRNAPQIGLHAEGVDIFLPRLV
jgi:hypothetical protein